MRRMILLMLPMVALLCSARAAAQDFRPSAVPITHHPISFRLNTPIAHLKMSQFVPSENTLFVGPTTFKLYTQPMSGIFLRFQWDMDASDGIAYSDWYDDQDNPAVVTHTYATPGKKAVAVHLEMYNSVGQRQEDTKLIELFVVPAPSAVYVDARGDSLYYWEGADRTYDKPVLNVEGFDPKNTLDPLGSYAMAFELAEQARALGYDMFFLNFRDGGADVAFNKDVFLGACRFAHVKLGAREGAVQVVGVSMGGAVARYGLAWAEEQARTGNVTDHYVNTFISYDAPLQGVHINLGLQKFLRERGTPEQQQSLQAVAARQLLYDDVYGSLHENFMTTFSNLNVQPDQITRGYPRLCRNFAISNGTLHSPYPNKVAGVDPLATLTIYKALTLFFFDIDALTADEVITIPCEPKDLMAGSTFTHDLRSLNNSGSVRKYMVGFPYSLVLSGYGHYDFTVHFNPSYQPTESALDLKGYYRTAAGGISGGTSLFDETLVQDETHRHDELTDKTKAKVLDWLNANRTYPYLSIPRNVSASMAPGNAIRISFEDASVFNDGVVVERKVEGGTFAAIAAAGPKATMYLDSDPALEPYARYVYRLRSLSGQRASAYSREVTVAFQPHLLSSTAAAIAGSAQHKALQTTSTYNNRFLVFESGGGSYLSRFVNDDAATGTWEPEVTVGGVPTETVQFRSPSLFPDSSGAVPRVIVDEVNTALGTHALRHGWFDEGTHSVSLYPEPLVSMAAPASFQPMAVAAMTDCAPGKPSSLLAAAWRTELNSGLAMGIGVTDASGNFHWSRADLNGGVLAVPVTFAGNPAIAAVLKSAGNSPAYHLYVAWEEENHGGSYGGIRLLHGRYTPGAQPWPPVAAEIIWESTLPFAVAQNTSSETHRAPSLTIDATGNVIIAWESASSAGGKILLQKRNGFTSGVLVSGTVVLATGSGSAMPHGVSLADYRAVPGMGDNLVAAWYTDGGSSYAEWYGAASNVWSTARLLDDAAMRPSLAVTKSALVDGRAVAVSGPPGPPYAIRTLTAGPLPPPLPAPQLSWQPVIINNVKRARLTWTAVGPDLQSYDVYMYTCDPGAGDCGDEAYHSLQTTTTALGYTDLNMIVFTKTASDPSPDRTNYYYVRGRDRFNQAGPSSAKAVVNTEEPLSWKAHSGSGDGLPRRYALSDNFPNPFNPTTTFRYELPAPGDVRIDLFNVAGERVMTLVNSPHEAGYYEAVWNARGSPSGVYMAAMHVTAPGGWLVYSTVKKVLLVR